MFTEKFKKQTKKRTLTYCLEQKREMKKPIQLFMLQGVIQPDDFQRNFH